MRCHVALGAGVTQWSGLTVDPQLWSSEDGRHVAEWKHLAAAHASFLATGCVTVGVSLRLLRAASVIGHRGALAIAPRGTSEATLGGGHSPINPARTGETVSRPTSRTSAPGKAVARRRRTRRSQRRRAREDPRRTKRPGSRLATSQRDVRGAVDGGHLDGMRSIRKAAGPPFPAKNRFVPGCLHAPRRGSPEWSPCRGLPEPLPGNQQVVASGQRQRLKQP